MLKIIKSIGIIPARYASTRFPGKPLVEIKGKSMVQRVYEQASKSLLDTIIVATDDERIFKHVESFGGRAVMTSPFHKSGTDRCAEVTALEEFNNVEFVVNIQGDEPFIEPAQIDVLVKFLSGNKDFPIATLAKLIEKEKELFDPNTVKTVFDKNGKALYFSRSSMPFLKNEKKEDWLAKSQFYKHIGIYGFHKNTLLEVAKLPQGKLEKAESLEQLRWLENGFAIGVQITEHESVGIDVPEDVATQFIGKAQNAPKKFNGYKMNYCSKCGSNNLTKKTPPGDNRPRVICGNCETIHYRNPKIIAGCLPVWEGKVLLAKRAIEPRKGYWNIPAGFMEIGESVEAGAMREVWEETEAKVELLGLLAVFTYTRFNHVYVQYLGNLVDGKYGIGEESLEVKLFLEEEIPWDEIAFESSIFALKKYFEDRKNGVMRAHYGSV